MYGGESPGPTEDAQNPTQNEDAHLDAHLNLFIVRTMTSMATVLALLADRHQYKYHVNMRRLVLFTLLFVLLSFLVFIIVQKENIILTTVWTIAECGLGLMNLSEAHMLNTILQHQNYHVGKLLYIMIVCYMCTIVTHNVFKLAYFVNSLISIYILYLIYKIKIQNIFGGEYKFVVGLNILQRLEIIILHANVVVMVYTMMDKKAYGITAGLFVIYHFKVCILYVLTWGLQNNHEDLLALSSPNLVNFNFNEL